MPEKPKMFTIWPFTEKGCWPFCLIYTPRHWLPEGSFQKPIDDSFIALPGLRAISSARLSGLGVQPGLHLPLCPLLSAFPPVHPIHRISAITNQSCCPAPRLLHTTVVSCQTSPLSQCLSLRKQAHTHHFLSKPILSSTFADTWAPFLALCLLWVLTH